jgi:hypothetical protein
MYVKKGGAWCMYKYVVQGGTHMYGRRRRSRSRRRMASLCYDKR